MKSVYSLILVLCLVMSACGGSPTAPSSPSGPSAGNTVNNSFSVSLSPDNPTMAVGESRTFTASGGDGYNYVFSPVEPADSFATDFLGGNRVQVRVVRRPSVAGRLKVEAMSSGGGYATASATITVK